MASTAPKPPNCARCPTKPCYRSPADPKPSFCPMVVGAEALKKAFEEYGKGPTRKIHQVASRIEKEGYCVWPRIREIAEFAKRMEFKKIGVAFCIGLSEEAKLVVDYLEGKGFEVYSVCCKCGGVDKMELGLKEEDKLSPGKHESICNPIAQAYLLNEAGTELNVVLGLCVGHDTLFIAHSKAPVTYLAVKDRVTGHNPLVALYARRYFRSRLGMEEA